MNEGMGLLGNGGQADEVEAYLADSHTEVTFRAVSDEYLVDTNPKLISVGNPKELKAARIIAAVGAPALRKKMIDEWPGKNYSVFVSDKALVGRNVSIGAGSVVAPGVTITTNVVVGEHVLINIGVTINHDCTIGSFTTISPGVHIAGKVHIGEGVFIGIGATISNGVTVSTGSIVGAGAVVLDDIQDENSVVVGIPAKVIKKNDGWLSEL